MCERALQRTVRHTFGGTRGRRGRRGREFPRELGPVLVPQLLVFDKVMSREEIDGMRRDPKTYYHVCRGGKWEQMWNDGRESYDEYKAALPSRKDDDQSALHNTELVFLKEFGHLFETVKRSYATCWKTRLASRRPVCGCGRAGDPGGSERGPGEVRVVEP